MTYKLPETILIEKETSKMIFPGATPSQLKSKGISTNYYDLIEVPNLIENVYLENILGSNSGRVTIVMAGTMNGHEINFDLSKQEFLKLIKTVSVEKSVFQSTFKIIFSKLSQLTLATSSDEYKNISKTIQIENEELPTKLEQEKLEKSKIRKRCADEIQSLKIGDIVLIDNKKAIYVGHKYFGYAKIVKHDFRYFAKKGYGFIFYNEQKPFQTRFSISILNEFSSLVKLNEFFDFDFLNMEDNQIIRNLKIKTNDYLSEIGPFTHDLAYRHNKAQIFFKLLALYVFIKSPNDSKSEVIKFTENLYDNQNEQTAGGLPFISFNAKEQNGQWY